MSNVDYYEPHYELSFDLSVSEKDGIKPILQMVLELKSEMGIETDAWILKSPGVAKKGDNVYFALSYEDAMFVLNGRMTEDEYLEKHRIRN